MAKAPCKCKPTECEECPEWIFTFADLVMLMMGFFVILWVLKPAPNPPKNGEQDQVLPMELLAAIRTAFGHLPDPDSKDPVDVWMLMRKLESLAPLKNPGEGGKTKIEPKAPKGAEPEVEMIRPSKQVGTGAKVIFNPADVVLSAESKQSLDQIADLIRGHANIFMVKGHTAADDLPEGSTEEARMDLSLKRARMAAEYLATKGVNRRTLRVQGCSTFEPVALRAYTTPLQALNRRVEIEETGTLVKDLEDNLKEKDRRAAIERKAESPKPKEAVTHTGHE